MDQLITTEAEWRRLFKPGPKGEWIEPGTRFGDRVVLGCTGRKAGRFIWRARCDCGAVADETARYFRDRHCCDKCRTRMMVERRLLRAQVESAATEARIEAALRMDSTGCIPWPGTLPNEYARAWRNGRLIRVSRELLERAYYDGQPLPAGIHALHACDYPPCVQLQHLRPGTPDENGMDRIISKRGVVADDQPHELHGGAKAFHERGIPIPNLRPPGFESTEE